MRAKSGGGITSNKLRQVYEPKTEPRAHKVNVDAAAMQGLTLGYERKPRDGKGYSQGPMPPTGIGNSYKKPDVPAPGSGRTIYRTGSQMQHGPANPGHVSHAPDPPATRTTGRDILSAYGRDVPGKGPR